MKSRAVLWDFDGTLAHTAPDMVAALHQWQAVRNQKPVDYEIARMCVSGGARALLRAAGMEESDPMYDGAREDFLARYEAGGYRRTVLFSGATETLRILNREGWKWGVVTNKPRRYFAPIASVLGMETNPEIDLPANAPPKAAVLVAGDDHAQSKPSPAPLLLAAQVAEVPPNQCIYIGDDRRDAEAAHAAGMPFILAGWGYWAAADWKNAPAAAAIASSPSCIVPLARMLAADFAS